MPGKVETSFSLDARLQITKRSFQPQISRKVDLGKSQLRWFEPFMYLGMGLMDLNLLRKRRKSHEKRSFERIRHRWEENIKKLP
jgi:hypothetical protein